MRRNSYRDFLWLVGGLLAVGAVAYLPTQVAAKKAAKRAAPVVHKLAVSVRPINGFHATGIGSQVHGKLRFLGGLVFQSTWSGFGGWSDLVIGRDGRRFLAVSDDGYWMGGRLNYRGLAPVGVGDVTRGEFQARSGRALKGKRERDAEGIALLNGTLEHGSALISFERIHRIGRFKIRKGAVVGPPVYLKLPREARALWRNKGLEAVGVLRGGRYKGAAVAVAERKRGAKSGGHRPAWILRSGRARQFFIKDRGNVDVTSVAGLLNGDLLLLERRFRWSEGVKMRIRRIAAKDIRPGAVVDGEVLVDAGLGYEVDNMEGLAVHRGPDGETILSVISDDNFNKLLQRTILLQFQLVDEPVRAGSR